MSIKEYRIVLPVSVEEYQVGQLYAVAEASKNETGGGEGVEVKVNEPYEKDGEKGQYTHKVYHLESKVPNFVRSIVPTGYLKLEEKAWNAYPKCRTVLENPRFKGFEIEICTMHVNDMGEQENVHGPDKKTVPSNDIINIDIADNNAISPKDYKAEYDPSKYKSKKTGRGPLGPDWKKELANNPNCPHMCAYKLVTIKCPWYLKMLPSVVIQMETRVFTHFHRQLFCWLDKWIDLTMDDIRRIEEETKKELDDMRRSEEVKGMGVSE